MAEDRVQRRLAAILVADVAGYSQLMGQDDEGTLAALTAHRTELIEPCIAEHRGRVVKTTGDGLLAEFASVVDAVRCAVASQEGMAERNADIPKDRRIEGQHLEGLSSLPTLVKRHCSEHLGDCLMSDCLSKPISRCRVFLPRR